MATVTGKITGDNTLIGNFTIQKVSDPTWTDLALNVKQASFNLEDGQEYAMTIEVLGNDGEKYKIKVVGASEAIYPGDEEFTLAGGRDVQLAEIVA